MSGTLPLAVRAKKPPERMGPRGAKDAILFRERLDAAARRAVGAARANLSDLSRRREKLTSLFVCRRRLIAGCSWRSVSAALSAADSCKRSDRWRPCQRSSLRRPAESFHPPDASPSTWFLCAFALCRPRCFLAAVAFMRRGEYANHVLGSRAICGEKQANFLRENSRRCYRAQSQMRQRFHGASNPHGETSNHDADLTGPCAGETPAPQKIRRAHSRLWCGRLGCAGAGRRRSRLNRLTQM